MKTETVLVTGASSGIGLHLAHAFARHSHKMVLVAQDEDELMTIAKDFDAKYQREPTIIACDLQDPASSRIIFNRLGVQGISIDILVNNAGHGLKGEWWK